MAIVLGPVTCSEPAAKEPPDSDSEPAVTGAFPPMVPPARARPFDPMVNGAATLIVPVYVPWDCTAIEETMPLSDGPVAGLIVSEPFNATA